MNTNSNTRIVCLDSDPASRSRIGQQMHTFGYDVIGTANPRIASAMAAEGNFSAFLVFVRNLSLDMLSAIVNTKHSQPNLPVILIFNHRPADSIPVGLADRVLFRPSADELSDAIAELTVKNRLAQTTA